MKSATRGKLVFVGDAVSALGFRLAGVESLVADDAALEIGGAALVLVTADSAARVRERLSGDKGVVLVIESARGDAAVADFELEVRRELGILP